MPLKEKYTYRTTVYKSRQLAAEAAAHDLQQEDYVDRRFGAETLYRIGAQVGPHVDAVCTSLGDEDAGVRYWGAIGLANIGLGAAGEEVSFSPGCGNAEKAESIASQLVALLSDDDPGIRYWATVAFACTGPATIAQHVEALQGAVESDKDPDVRVAAARTLVVGAPADKLAATAKTLGWAVTDEDQALFRASAAEALGELGPAIAQPYAGALEAALDDRSAKVRTSAAKTIRTLGFDAVSRASIALSKISTCDPDEFAREAAATALKLLDPVLALSSEDTSMRLWAVEVLAGQAASKIKPHFSSLITLAGDVNDDVRYWACVALSVLDPLDSQIQADKKHPNFVDLVPLCALLQDPVPRVRVAGARALKTLDPEAVPRLAELLVPSLQDANYRIRASTAEALGVLGRDAQAHAADMYVALNDEFYEVRLAVLRALGTCGRGAVRGADAQLAKLGRSDPDGEVRRAAVDVLRENFLAAKFGLD